MGASLLTAVGLADWAVGSEDAYVSRAVAAAGDVPALAALRASMRSRVAASPLCDGAGFVRRLEGVYSELFARWEAREGGGQHGGREGGGAAQQQAHGRAPLSSSAASNAGSGSTSGSGSDDSGSGSGRSSPGIFGNAGSASGGGGSGSVSDARGAAARVHSASRRGQQAQQQGGLEALASVTLEPPRQQGVKRASDDN